MTVKEAINTLKQFPEDSLLAICTGDTPEELNNNQGYFTINIDKTKWQVTEEPKHTVVLISNKI